MRSCDTTSRSECDVGLPGWPPPNGSIAHKSASVKQCLLNSGLVQGAVPMAGMFRPATGRRFHTSSSLVFAQNGSSLKEHRATLRFHRDTQRIFMGSLRDSALGAQLCVNRLCADCPGILPSGCHTTSVVSSLGCQPLLLPWAARPMPWASASCRTGSA